MEQKGEPNSLIHETSPYLLQHAYNPVHWYPWNEAALAAARKFDRPILLSIGYSACHWCHVMERESFEDEEIASLMNENFINIKVDREERPDLDAIYMNYVQMSTGSGGWPMTVFLTPELVPFYGGTYFPPKDHYGRPGFPRVLESVAAAFRDKRQEVEQASPQVVARLQQASGFDTPEGEVAQEILEEAAQTVKRQFDGRYGGFGGAPKFPSSMLLGFLLRHHHATASSEALEMVNLSLTKMALGGIYDQLGGGFHRYSVDDRWLVPHFEKMLYDNALLSQLYLEAFQVTGNELFRETAEETLEYVLRDLTDPGGGFYSAEDADSEGEEGKFYVWQKSEITAVLGDEDGSLFCNFYDVTQAGNFEGKNILNRPFEGPRYASELGVAWETLKSRLDRMRKKLFELREDRPRPLRDDKVLASWNGMMLVALAKAALVLNRNDFHQAAVRNGEFLAREMIVDDRVRRTWKAGQGARLNGYLEDYAALSQGMLGLFELTADPKWFRLARRLTDRQFELFQDRDKGDFYFTSSDHEKLLVRHKEHLDNATPSGNSTTCHNLLRLARLTDDEKYRSAAVQLLRQMAMAAARHPSAFGNWLQAFSFHLNPGKEIVLIGPAESREQLLAPLRIPFQPSSLLLLAETEIPGIALLKGKKALEGKATAFVCENFSCRQPVTSPDALMAELAMERGVP